MKVNNWLWFQYEVIIDNRSWFLHTNNFMSEKDRGHFCILLIGQLFLCSFLRTIQRNSEAPPPHFCALKSSQSCGSKSVVHSFFQLGHSTYLDPNIGALLKKIELILNKHILWEFFKNESSSLSPTTSNPW